MNLLYWQPRDNEGFMFFFWTTLLIGCIIQIYSGIKSGRVLNGELLYTEILEVNLFVSRISVYNWMYGKDETCM